MDYSGRDFDIKQDYFEWLCEIVHADQYDRSWRILMRDLHRKKFYAVMPNDENRAGDGIELREEYLREIWYPKYADLGDECTVLEMLIGLAQRIDYELKDPYDDQQKDNTAKWFWEMLDNLGLTRFDDESYAEKHGLVYVNDIINTFLKRKYKRNGEGGLFPLIRSNKDQRHIEIWYQMSAYLEQKEAV